MVQQLATWDHYNSRISATNILHLCYSKVSELEREDLIQLLQQMSKDDTPMVRRGVAQNIGN